MSAPLASKRALPAHGWFGLAVIVGAEISLMAGEPTVAGWFTPIVWTGYVLFVDALVRRLTGCSYFTSDGGEGVLVAIEDLGLGLDYADRYRERIGRVTTLDVQRVAAKFFPPAAFSRVVVGEGK